MQFFGETQIEFLRHRRLWMSVSAALILAGIVSLVARGGPRFSVDFTGGTVVELHVSPAVDVGQVREALQNAGLQPEQVTTFGSREEFLINLAPGGAASSSAPDTAAAEQAVADPARSNAATIGAGESVRQVVASALAGHDVELRRQETVGPKIGHELKTAAINSIVIALGLIMIYISVRFVFQYALGAVFALGHDVMITLGIFSLTNKEVSLAIVAAFLTIVGFSVNDTIVVFDRVRENLRLRRKETFEEILNRSVNETLSRTIITSGTVLITSIVLYLVGGSVIHDFAFAMSVGIIVGTYSSIYIASPVVLAWYNWRARQMRRTKKTAAAA